MESTRAGFGVNYSSPAPPQTPLLHHKLINPQTVNPVAVNEDLDVFTENKRDITLLSVPQANDTPITVAFVAIGAMLVGSVQSTVQQGQEVGRGEELGYFGEASSCVGEGGC